MTTTRAEENYLKAIYHLSQENDKKVMPNSIAQSIKVSPASVVEMIGKLTRKKLIYYQRRAGATLTRDGEKIALDIVRSHRLWEVFLVNKLNYSWEKIHDIAEQLEHVKDPELVDKLEDFLNYPNFDPHGDPIPDKDGNYLVAEKKLLSQMDVGAKCNVVSVSDENADFLKHLEKLMLSIGSHIQILEKNVFDDSLIIRIDSNPPVFVSNKISKSLFVN